VAQEGVGSDTAKRNGRVFSKPALWVWRVEAYLPPEAASKCLAGPDSAVLSSCS
jgi:hypothetical protein